MGLWGKLLVLLFSGSLCFGDCKPLSQVQRSQGSKVEVSEDDLSVIIVGQIWPRKVQVVKVGLWTLVAWSSVQVSPFLGRRQKPTRPRRRGMLRRCVAEWHREGRNGVLRPSFFLGGLKPLQWF